MKRRVTEKQIDMYRKHLIDDEKSQATVEKYVRDVRKFIRFIGNTAVDKEQVIDYKKHLVGGYKAASVNSMLAALNSFFTWQGLDQFKVKPLKVQRQIFRPQERELSKAEYKKLLHAAGKKGDERLNLIMQTICATGIRISELSFITAESLEEGYIQINCKNKTRYIWMPERLRCQLKKYIRKHGNINGPVFVNHSKMPLSRSTIWMQMKHAAEAAGVDQKKVYPHNLRHLFARTFYQMDKDIIRLSDILGHSSVETTRIYTKTSGKEYAGYLERMGLVIENT